MAPVISEPDRPSDDETIEIPDGSLPDSLSIPADKRLQNLTGGSRKGKPNKVGSQVARDILAAYKLKGGVKWLSGLSNKDFIAVFKGIIPKEIDLGTSAITSRDVAEQLVLMQQRGGLQ